MARIDWAVLCDLAFFDRHDRLSIIGVIRTLSAPTLPMTLHQAVLVARLADIQPVDEVRGVRGSGDADRATQSPNRIGECDNRIGSRVRGRDPTWNPASEEGIHRFQVQLRGQPVISLDVPVLSCTVSTLAQVQ